MSKKKSTTPGSKKPATTKATKPKGSKPKATREHVVAQAKADQENAARRDERAASADGMTASERAMTESAAAAGGKKKTKATMKQKPAAKAKTPKQASLIDAAAQVLAGSKEPMACKAIVDAVTEKKLWAPRNGGKTPHATLYSSILREIQNKGKDARFKKVDRGQFTMSKKG